MIQVVAAIVYFWTLQTATAGEYQDLLRRGDEARDAGELLTAVSLFREAIRNEPQNPLAYVKAAEAYGDAFEEWGLRNDDLAGVSLWIAPADWRKHKESTYHFSMLCEPCLPSEPSHDRTVPIEVFHLLDLAEMATQLAPRDSSAWRWLGEAHFAVRRVFDQEDDYELEADRCFRRAVELAPDDAALRNRVGRVYFECNRPVEALPHFDAAIRLAPDNTEYLLDRSACRMKLGDIAGATRDLKAFGIAPEGVAELELRAAASDPTTVVLQTSTILSRYIRLHPEEAPPLAARAQLFMTVKDYAYALIDIELALTIDPQHPAYLVFHADVLRRIGRNDEALEAANKAQRLRPYNADIETLRVACLTALRRTEEAGLARQRSKWLAKWLSFRKIIGDKPDDSKLWYGGGLVALELQEWETAKTCLHRASEHLTDRRNQSLIDSALAKACLRSGAYQAAIDAATQAIRHRDSILEEVKDGTLVLPVSSPRDAMNELTDAVVTRAEAREAVNDFDGAISDYEAVNNGSIELAARLAEIYLRRAEHREAHGDAAGAAEDRKHAESLQQNPFDVPSASP